MIDAARLHQLALEDKIAITTAIAGPLETHVAASTINNLLRRVHFLAQICYESEFFTRLEEDLFYSNPARIAAVWPKLASRAESLIRNPQALANAAYAGEMGNGDEASGDGYLFRGRGLIQITGRWSYSHYSAKIDADLVSNPELAASPDIAVRLAIAYWEGVGCDEAADRDSISDVTVKINPAREGLSERTFLTNRGKTIFT